MNICGNKLPFWTFCWILTNGVLYMMFVLCQILHTNVRKVFSETCWRQQPYLRYYHNHYNFTFLYQFYCFRPFWYLIYTVNISSYKHERFGSPKECPTLKLQKLGRKRKGIREIGNWHNSEADVAFFLMWFIWNQ